MQKNLYIRDTDVEVWDRAAELADQPLSQLVTALLRDFIDSKGRGYGPVTEVEPGVFTVYPISTSKMCDPSRGPIRHSRPVAFRGRELHQGTDYFSWITEPGGRVLFYSEDMRHLWAWDSVADLQAWVDQNPLGGDLDEQFDAMMTETAVSSPDRWLQAVYETLHAAGGVAYDWIE